MFLKVRCKLFCNWCVISVWLVWDKNWLKLKSVGFKVKECTLKSQFCAFGQFKASIMAFICGFELWDTGYWSSKSDESNSIDRVFQVNETAQLGSNVTNDSSANPNHCNWTDKAKISIEKSCRFKRSQEIVLTKRKNALQTLFISFLTSI